MQNLQHLFLNVPKMHMKAKKKMHREISWCTYQLKKTSSYIFFKILIQCPCTPLIAAHKAISSPSHDRKEFSSSQSCWTLRIWFSFILRAHDHSGTLCIFTLEQHKCNMIFSTGISIIVTEKLQKNVKCSMAQRNHIFSCVLCCYRNNTVTNT